jgi:hypothetical protein
MTRAEAENTLRAAYWARQFESISSTVEPERFDQAPHGSIVVTVQQTVRDPNTNELQSDTHVLHRYRLEDGLIVRTAWRTA